MIPCIFQEYGGWVWSSKILLGILCSCSFLLISSVYCEPKSKITIPVKLSSISIDLISNFVGFLPASNPKLLSAIVLDEPESPMHWGGQGAAVAFKRIMQRIINMDDNISPPLKKTNKKESELIAFREIKAENKNKSFPLSLSTIHVDKKTRVPDAIGMSLKKAIKIISGAGLKLKINGSGKVISQSPKPGKLIRNNEVCTITLR